MSRTLPQPTPTSEPYWQGCLENELRLQRCDNCSHVQFYARIFCTSCQSKDLSWIVATGRGCVASYTVMHVSVSDAYQTPLVVALIDLEEGPRMMSHIVGQDVDSVAVGDLVSVQFEAWNDDVKLPVFILVRDEVR